MICAVIFSKKFRFSWFIGCCLLHVCAWRGGGGITDDLLFSFLFNLYYYCQQCILFSFLFSFRLCGFPIMIHYSDMDRFLSFLSLLFFFFPPDCHSISTSEALLLPSHSSQHSYTLPNAQGPCCIATQLSQEVCRRMNKIVGRLLLKAQGDIAVLLSNSGGVQ